MLPHTSILSLPPTKKHRRRTIQLIHSSAAPSSSQHHRRQCRHEVYVRELNLNEAGLGCAVWDGAIILARYLHHEQQKSASFLANKNILELGSGVGLPALVCARYSRQVIMSDYENELVKNALYNIKLNSNLEEEDEEDEEEEKEEEADAEAEVAEGPAPSRVTAENGSKEEMRMRRRAKWYEEKRRLKMNVRDSAKAVLLDWHDVPELDEQGQWRNRPRESPQSECKIDAPLSSSCSSGEFRDPTGLGPFSFDLVIGSEIMYTESIYHRKSLAATVDYYLRPSARFLCLQSANREGMREFVQLMFNDYGYQIRTEKVEEWKWMKGMALREKGLSGFVQREEEYWLYEFTKPSVRNRAEWNEKEEGKGLIVSEVELPTVEYFLDAEAVYASTVSSLEPSCVASILSQVTSEALRNTNANKKNPILYLFGATWTLSGQVIGLSGPFICGRTSLL